MALQVDFTTQFGFECAESYHQVSSLVYDKGLKVKGCVRVFKDVAAKNGSLMPIETNEFYFDWAPNDTNNIVADAYEYLKTLPAYAGALDV
jgi:hypothetical protein